ncbi:Leucine-rich repeat receptor-like serine/threonine-protein kinase BAM2 [Morella rubra]|uniref:Leucine-rich repeat receptor-like serine/threonine-protein kinase BAM2 n=1 Tax=Morella rubra TaxID=262757 RepID=A0A6A1UV73_9ROSI|nr:Leucine-rich repeat receptor-like serine/threonine-protein kinase BAM2 [Morella rubra]
MPRCIFGAFYLSPTGLLLILVAAFSERFLLLGDSRTYPGDIEVLKELKNGLNVRSLAPGSCLSSWDFSLDPCDHIFGDHFTCGFRCDGDVSGLHRVTEITLDPAGYSGSLSSITWSLPYLQTLDVSDNYLSGSIPDSASNLTRLRRLSLSRNSLSGQIPDSLASLSELEELYLDNNQLDGSIPSSFNGLVSLKRLEIQRNNLKGEIPDLGSLRNLYFFDASDNELSGEVPTTLPSSLIGVSISNNDLKGNLPVSLGKLAFLEVMDLSHNRLGGPVISVLFGHPSLEQLTLSHNNFTSLEVPRNNGVDSRLVALDLSNNELSGLLPGFLGWMPKLSALSLEHNKFTGMIPTQYALRAAVPAARPSSFHRLLLDGNYLFGPIPDALMGLKPGSVNVSLIDNCLYRCPDTFFFCQGGDQKSLVDCKSFGPMIP